MPTVLTTGTNGPASLVYDPHPADRPAPGAGQVAVEVSAVGVNPADLLAITGAYQNTPEIPFSPGFEFAGTVAATGPGTTRCRTGQPVMGLVPLGAFTDRLLVPEHLVVPLPDTIDPNAAAALPVAAVTAHVALFERAALGAADTLVVTGAGGNVGRAAVQSGRAAGADVIAVVHRPELVAVAETAGARHVIDTSVTGTDGLTARIRTLTGGRGADVTVDLTGGDTTQVLLAATASGGRLLFVGLAAGPPPPVGPVDLLLGNASLVGIDVVAYIRNEPLTVARALDRTAALLADGRLTAHTDRTHPLRDAAEVLAGLASGALRGKTTLTIASH